MTESTATEPLPTEPLPTEPQSPSGSSINDEQLPSVLFAIPFPRPANHYKVSDSSPPFLLYTFPRSVYEKPAIDPATGKPGKEKLVKKAERVWQQEVREGEEIKRGEHKDASGWQKFKGGAARIASSVIKYMPNNTIETLGRLPPKKKLGTLEVIYPHPQDASETMNVPSLTEDQMKEAFTKILQSAKKKAFTNSIISGCLLPVSAAIDFFLIIPVFAFEVNIAYFALQTNGARKVAALTSVQNQATKRNSQPTSPRSEQETDHQIQTDATASNTSVFSFEQAPPQALSKSIEYLYSQCSMIDARKFPPLSDVPLPNYNPDRNIVEGMIKIFQMSLPENVVHRHLLNPDRAAEDLARTLHKAAKEYVKTLT